MANKTEGVILAVYGDDPLKIIEQIKTKRNSDFIDLVPIDDVLRDFTGIQSKGSISLVEAFKVRPFNLNYAFRCSDMEQVKKSIDDNIVSAANLLDMLGWYESEQEPGLPPVFYTAIVGDELYVLKSSTQQSSTNIDDLNSKMQLQDLADTLTPCKVAVRFKDGSVTGVFQASIADVDPALYSLIHAVKKSTREALEKEHFFTAQCFIHIGQRSDASKVSFFAASRNLTFPKITHL